MSSLYHKLPIEVGSYSNIPRNQRLCELCTLQEIGDKFHYLFKCTHFAQKRRQYIDGNLFIPNTMSMKTLFQTKGESLSNLCKFISCIMEEFSNDCYI